MPRLNFIIFTQPWSSVTLPIVKRVFAEISAKDFVSVQPTNQPSGLVFYLDFKYGVLVAIIFEELWWEEDENGNWYCPQTNDDDRISDKDWGEAWDDVFVIPKWEVEQQEQYVGGLGNKSAE